LHVKQVSHGWANWNVFCDEVLADDEENAGESSLLENFVGEHEAPPHHAFHPAYVVNVGVLFLKTFDWPFFVREGFNSANVSKRLLSNSHHLTLWLLVGFIVLPVETHENSIAENTRGDEQKGVERQFPAISKHDDNHADDCAKSFDKSWNTLGKTILHHLSVGLKTGHYIRISKMQAYKYLLSDYHRRKRRLF